MIFKKTFLGQTIINRDLIVTSEGQFSFAPNIHSIAGGGGGQTFDEGGGLQNYGDGCGGDECPGPGGGGFTD